MPRAPGGAMSTAVVLRLIISSRNALFAERWAGVRRSAVRCWSILECDIPSSASMTGFRIRPAREAILGLQGFVWEDRLTASRGLLHRCWADVHVEQPTASPAGAFKLEGPLAHHRDPDGASRHLVQEDINQHLQDEEHRHQDEWPYHPVVHAPLPAIQIRERRAEPRNLVLKSTQTGFEVVVHVSPHYARSSPASPRHAYPWARAAYQVTWDPRSVSGGACAVECWRLRIADTATTTPS